MTAAKPDRKEIPEKIGFNVPIEPLYEQIQYLLHFQPGSLSNESD